MRINSIGAYRQMQGTRNVKQANQANAVNNVSNVSKATNGSVMITFGSGNPKHLFQQIAEFKAIFNKGGVGTVGWDWATPPKPADGGEWGMVIQNVPLYNSRNIYEKNEAGKVEHKGVEVRRIPEGLPDDHPLKSYEGCPFATNADVPANVVGNAEEYAKLLARESNKIIVLEEVGKSTISSGLAEDIPVSIYTLKDDAQRKKLGLDQPEFSKFKLTFTYIDSTSSLSEPYGDGSYRSVKEPSKDATELVRKWRGDAYVEECKATAELLPMLKEKMGFDPKYIVCHDAYSTPLMFYGLREQAKESAKGKTAETGYWMGKQISTIAHNFGDGYIKTLSPIDVVSMLSESPAQLREIRSSNEYIQSLLYGRENEFLMGLVPEELKDARGNVNTFMIPLAAERDMATVSPWYAQAVLNNPEVAPALRAPLLKYYEKGLFHGITNPLNDPKASGYKNSGLDVSYRNGAAIQIPATIDGGAPEIVRVNPFKVFDKTKIETSDGKLLDSAVDHIREIKKYNQENFLERLELAERATDSQFIPFMTEEVEENGIKKTVTKLDDSGVPALNMDRIGAKGSGIQSVVTGGTGEKRVFELESRVSKEIIDEIKAGKVDHPMFVCWGRGDFQKGLDTALESWILYAKNEPEDSSKSIFILGGQQDSAAEDIRAVINKYRSDLDGKLKGRFAIINGWAPGASFAAMGDYAILPSRFAPCELTDLEGGARFCTPVVPSCQGLKKVGKAGIGYAGEQEYYISREDALKFLEQKAKVEDGIEPTSIQKAAKTELEKFKKGFDKIKTKYHGKKGYEISEAELASDPSYGRLLKELRDTVIACDLAEQMGIATNIRRTNPEEALKLCKSQMEAISHLGWETNAMFNPVRLGDPIKDQNGKVIGAKLKEDPRSAAKAYQEAFFTTDRPDAKNELSLNWSKQTEQRIDSSIEKAGEIIASSADGKTTVGDTLKEVKKSFWKSAKGKWAIGGIAAAAAGIVAFVGYRAGWFGSKDKDQTVAPAPQPTTTQSTPPTQSTLTSIPPLPSTTTSSQNAADKLKLLKQQMNMKA